MEIIAKPKNRGVIYVAFGRPYLAMALYSRVSLARTNPGLPACIVTNLQIEKTQIPMLGVADTVISLDAEVAKNRSIKTAIIDYTPFEETIFLDCDTVVMGRLDKGFEYLRYFDICARLNPYPQTRRGKADIPIFDGLEVGDCPHWNSGVLIFSKSGGARRFFRDWAGNFRSLGNQYDQVSLAKTIFECPVRFLSLDRRWNATDPFIGRRAWRQKTKVFHYATNISDSLLSDVCRTDHHHLKPILGETEVDSRRFLLDKRRSKRDEHGMSKYLMLRLIWAFTCPTG